MSRPKFLNCVMTPEIIRVIRNRQAEYDKDPEAYERQERQEKEQREKAKWEEYNRQQDEIEDRANDYD